MPETVANLIGRRRGSAAASHRRAWLLLEAGIWGSLGLALAYFVGAADWIGVALVLGLLGGCVLVLIDPKLTAMLWLGGQPTLFVFFNNAASEIPFFTMERALFMVLLSIVIARRVFHSGSPRPFSSTEWIVLAFLTVLSLSFAITLPGKEPATIRSDLALLFQCYFMPWLSVLIAARLDWSERDVLRLLRVLGLAGLLLVVIGGLQHFFKVSWFTPRYFEVIHSGRAAGTFANAVEYGSVMAGLALLTLAQFIYARSPLFKAILCGAAAGMLAAVLLSMSRSPLVGAAAGLLFLFLRDPRIRPLLILGAIVALIVGALAIPFLLDTAGLLARMQEIEPIYNRVALFATASQMVLAHPLIGVGFGRYAFSDNKTDYLTGFGPVTAQWAADIGIPHLEYLHIMVLTGLLGGLLYAMALFMLWRNLRRIALSEVNSPFTRTFAIYVQAVFVSIVVNGFFVDFMAYNYFAALVYFLVGVAISVARPGFEGQFYRTSTGNGAVARDRTLAEFPRYPGR